MGKQGVTAVHDVGDGIDLVRTQGDFRVHTVKTDMLTVIFTGTNGVKGFVVDTAQKLTTVNIFPEPFRKLRFDKLLPVLCNGGFLFIEDTLLVAVFVDDRIKDTHILLV